MSTEIKCPKCGTIFTVDESEYATLLEQVRTKEFDASVKKETDRIMRDMKKDAELAAMKAAAENANIVAQKDTYIAELKPYWKNSIAHNRTWKVVLKQGNDCQWKRDFGNKNKYRECTSEN